MNHTEYLQEGIDFRLKVLRSRDEHSDEVALNSIRNVRKDLGQRCCSCLPVICRMESSKMSIRIQFVAYEMEQCGPLPLLTLIYGPSISSAEWANSGPLEAMVCSCVVLPKEGSLSRAVHQSPGLPPPPASRGEAHKVMHRSSGQG